MDGDRKRKKNNGEKKENLISNVKKRTHIPVSTRFVGGRPWGKGGKDTNVFLGPGR